MPVIEIDVKVNDKELSEFEKSLRKIASTFSESTFATASIHSGGIGVGPSNAVNFIFGILLSYFGEKAFDEAVRMLENFIKESIDSTRPKSANLDRLQALETKARDLRKLAKDALQEANEPSASPDSIFNDLPLDKELIQERIDLLNTLLGKITLLRDELKHGALRSGGDSLPVPGDQDLDVKKSIDAMGLRLEIDPY